MAVVTLKNAPIQIDLAQLAVDNGWRVSGGVAYHDSCFAGQIELKNVLIEENTTYVIEYEVLDYVSGSVNVIAGGVSGASVSANGIVTQTIVVPNNPEDLKLRFFSDGELGIKYFNVYPVLENADNGNILGFNIDKNIWTTYYSGERENMLKFNNDFFAFQNGRLWKMNANLTRNNFFGVQYTSRITLVVNSSPTEIKNYFSIRQKSNKAWGVPSIIIPPSTGKANGMESLIKAGNFKVLNNGDLFADFLRDKTDPRFGDELTALFKGALLQGNYAIVTFENTSTDEIRTLSIDFLISKQDYTY
jgi:hypothetical protein